MGVCFAQVGGGGEVARGGTEQLYNEQKFVKGCLVIYC